MNSSKKKHKNLFLLGLLLISFLYLFIRLYHLNTLIGFRLDQGLHLLETKSLFDSKKISLLGPMVTSKSFMGRNVFIGSNYYYVLGTLGLISRWDPLIITIFFIFLEYIFFLFFILFLKRKFNSIYALIIFIFIAISPYLVVHSRFFWNTHFLIPLSILVLLFSEKYFFKKKFRYLFLAAFFWGFAFASHYSAILWGLLFLYIIVKSHQYSDLKPYLVIISGFILCDFPFLIFEIRHNFYNIKTLFYIFINSPQSRELPSQHVVFPFLIFTAFILLSLLSKIEKKAIGGLILVIILLASFLFQNRDIKNYAPLDIIPGWNYPEQQKVADLIVKNGCPQNFNVAATIQGDTRFYDLRYLLNLRGCDPLSVEAYPQAKKLFLVAPPDRPVESETVWEVMVFNPFKIIQRIPINDQIIFFELDKITK